MSKTNCINCGAAKDIDAIKCPFCGTTYVDLTAIDFGSDKPVACQFMLPRNISGTDGKRVVMSMLAIPQLDEIVQTPNTVCVEYGFRRSLFVESYDINVGVSFRPVSQPDKTLIELREE